MHLHKPLFLVFIWIIGSHTIAFATDSIPAVKSNLKYIDPTIGNVGWLLEPTRPTMQLPNQLIRITPQRKDYMDDQIADFPLTIVSHRSGQVFSIKPFSGAIAPESWDAKMTYDHDLEINRPWYYSTYLVDQEITVEFTPGKKTGIYRFHFPVHEKNKSILLSVYNEGDAFYHFISSHEITGMETYHDNIKVYMYGVFNKVGITGGVANQQLSVTNKVEGNQIKAYIRFPASDSLIEFKYAISYVSEAQARKNFEEEILHKSFKEVAKAGEKIWDKIMSQIQVEGGTTSQKWSFYTALYRCHERMVNITEDSLYYSGYDNQVHQDPRPFYVDDWSWDTYLALHPLRMLLHPAQEEDMLHSYTRMYEQSKWMPTFPLLFGDNPCMNGFHSSIIFLDAYKKGLGHFNIEKAYEGIRKNALEATLLPWTNGPKTVLDDFYQSHGYFPALPPGAAETVKEVHSFEKRQAVAVTLGASYDDWAAAELARSLGKTQDVEILSKRGNNYKNLWNNENHFFMPKDEKGNWIAIDPKIDGGMGGRDYYDENNGWTYLWQVQHDIPGLIHLMGGKQKFEDRLDQLFREDLGRSKYSFWSRFPDATGLVGQYSMGNEPSFFIPYLYNYTSAPWKTQKRIRFLLDVWFKDNIFGIPGDEDGGGMSAFVVFSSMGFYPITPGIPVYAIGSPVFSKVTIALENGKKFTMIAHHCSVVNKYIQSARLNGKELKQPWLTHAELINNGLLELEMGPKPNKGWGVME